MGVIPALALLVKHNLLRLKVFKGDVIVCVMTCRETRFYSDIYSQTGTLTAEKTQLMCH